MFIPFCFISIFFLCSILFLLFYLCSLSVCLFNSSCHNKTSYDLYFTIEDLAVISYLQKKFHTLFTSTPILFLLFSSHVRLEDFTLFYACRKFYHLGTLLGQCLTAIAARISTKHPQILHIPFNKFVHSPHFFNLRSYSEFETLSSSEDWKYSDTYCEKFFFRHIF